MTDSARPSAIPPATYIQEGVFRASATRTVEPVLRTRAAWLGHALLERLPIRLAESFSQYAVRMCARAFAVALSLVTLGCDEPNGSSSPTTPSGSTAATVRIVFMGATARRTDLPVSAQTCVSGVGATHTHPSWRSFATTPMQPVPPDRYEISFTDVPINTRVSFRVNDQNACDENPTGAVTRNVLANDVRLIQNTTTPGNGDEPGFAFSIAPNGAISQ
jgi:hypothetical protein